MSANGMNGEDQMLHPVASGAKAALPIVLGYLSIGFAAGVVQRSAGLSVLEIVLLSLLLYAGSAQFVIAGLVAATAVQQLPIVAIIATVFLVNVRHLLLSAALAPYFAHERSLKNALLGLQLTDETFVIAWRELMTGRVSPDLRTSWMAGLNLAAYSSWAIANFAGAMVNDLVGDPRSLGLDFALPAMFCALLVTQLGTPDQSDKRGAARRVERKTLILAATLSMLIAILANRMNHGSWSVLIATLLAATLALIMERTWNCAKRS